jgi:hypothetical protein
MFVVFESFLLFMFVGFGVFEVFEVVVWCVTERNMGPDSHIPLGDTFTV